MKPKSDHCPFCKADLRGQPIPKRFKKHYGKRTHFSRKIGIYSVEQDRTITWQCPDCGKQWERK